MEDENFRSRLLRLVFGGGMIILGLMVMGHMTSTTTITTGTEEHHYVLDFSQGSWGLTSQNFIIGAILVLGGVLLLAGWGLNGEK